MATENGIMMREISLQDIEGLRIGHAQDHQAKTGVTVLAFPQGARAGVDISGGGPASRETPVLSPLTADVPVHAIVLSGGSAYGLAAADGVMACLEERGIGYNTGFALVPIVCQSCIYDLGYGSNTIRPDKAMGYQACLHALEQNQHPQGNYGAGTGATTGKLTGMNRASKAGVGIYGVEVAGLQMAAIVVVNALGDIFSATTGEKLAVGYAYDGKINVIFGTHTHVQTADEQILPNGTGYISDVGMCGESGGVIGMDAECVVERIRTKLPYKFKVAGGTPVASAVIFTLDNTSHRVTNIKRLKF